MYLSFRSSQDQEQKIEDYARQNRMTKSEAIRFLIDAGFKQVGVAIDQTDLYETVKQAVQDAQRPSVERLAAMLAKAVQIGTAAFFMGIYGAAGNATDVVKASTKEAVSKSRSLGVQYLKLRDRDIDDFLSEGAGQIMDMDED